MAETNNLQSQQYVDFGEFIHFQVERAKSLIRQADLLLLASTATVSILFLLLGFVLLDHWGFQQGLSQTFRWLGFTSLLLVLVYSLLYFFRTIGSRNVTELYAAKALEKADPRLGNNLLTLVDLQVNERNPAPLIHNSLEKRAALALNHLDVDLAVDRRALLNRLYALLVGVVLLFGYAFLSQKSVGQSLLRLLFPWSTAVAPTETRIFEILPGNQTVTAGTHVEISAFLEGKIPESVWLVYSTADRSVVDEKIKLYETGEGLGKYQGTITGENGRGVDQPTHYHLQAGDARSAEYLISVKPAPYATLKEVKLTPPAYTKLLVHTQQNGSIDAVEGTVVELAALTNMPVNKAWIQLYNSEDPADRSGQLPLKIHEKNQLTGSWTLKIRDDGTYPRFYQIECETTEGARDPAPPRHAILIRPDARPEVRLLDPVTDLERPVNATVPLLIEAFDPDFRLSGLSIQVEKQGQILSSELIDAKNQQSLQLQHMLELHRLLLQPGDEIMFWVEARDNREPQPNRRSTSKLKIRLTEAVSAEQAEQQKLSDQQRQQEQSEQKASEQKTGDPASPMPNRQQNAEENSPIDYHEEALPTPGEQGSPTQNPEEGAGKTSPQQSRSEGQQQQPGSGDQPENSEDPADQQSPQFNPDGQDDDQVLQKLIEKMQQQQDSAAENPQEKSPPEASPPSKPEQEQQSGQDATGSENSAEQSESGASSEMQQEGKSETASEQNSRNSQKTESQGMTSENSSSQGSGQSEKNSADGPPQADGKQGAEKQGAGEQNSQTTDSTGKPNAEQPGTDSEKNSPQPGGAAKSESQNAQGMPQPDSSGKPEGSGNEQNPSAPENSDQGGTADQKTPSGENADPSATDSGMPASPTGKESTEVDQNSPAMNSGENQNNENSDSKTMPQNSADTPQSSGKTQSSDNVDGSPQDSGTATAGQEKKNSEQSASSEDTGSGSSETSSTGSETMGTETNPGDSSGNGSGGNSEEMSTQPAEKTEGGEPNVKSPATPDSGKPPEETAQNMQESAADNSNSPSTGVDPSKAGETPPSDSEQISTAKPASADQNDQIPTEAPEQVSNAQTGSGKGTAGSDTISTAAGPRDNTIWRDDTHSVEDRRRAAELVLKKLDEDLKRGDIDADLLKELGWNETQLKQFQQRMAGYTGQQQLTDQDQLRQRQFEEMLKNIRIEGKRSERTGKSGGITTRDEFAPQLTPAPAEYREIERGFRNSLSEITTP